MRIAILSYECPPEARVGQLEAELAAVRYRREWRWGQTMLNFVTLGGRRRGE